MYIDLPFCRLKRFSSKRPSMAMLDANCMRLYIEKTKVVNFNVDAIYYRKENK